MPPRFFVKFSLHIFGNSLHTIAAGVPMRCSYEMNLRQLQKCANTMTVREILRKLEAQAFDESRPAVFSKQLQYRIANSAQRM